MKLSYRMAGAVLALLVAVFVAPLAMGALNVPTKGLRLVDGNAISTAHNQMNNYAVQSVTALGSTQATAAQLLNPLAYVGTSSASTGVALPNCYAGQMQYVVNNSGQTITVYGKNGTTDTINATAGSTGVTMTNNTMKTFACPVNGKWGSQ